MKLLQKFSRWLYDKTHDDTINYYLLTIESLVIERSTLTLERNKLKQELDAGLVEAKIVRSTYSPRKISVAELVDNKLLKDPGMEDYVNRCLCKKIGNFIYVNKLAEIKKLSSSAFSPENTQVIATIEVLQKEV